MTRFAAGWVVLVTALAGRCDESRRLKAIHAAKERKLEALRPELAKLAEAPTTTPAVRRAAVEALVALGGEKSADVFRRMARGKQPYPVRVLGVAGLAALEPKEAAARAAEVLTSPGADRADLSDLFAAFLRRKGGARLLA